MASLLNTPVKRDVEEVELLGGYAVVEPCDAGYHLIKVVGEGLYSCIHCGKGFTDAR